MLKTIAPLFREIIKQKEGKQIISVLLIVAIAVPLFLGYYYADVVNDNRALRIELKEKDVKIEKITNTLVQKIELCEREKRDIQEYHINKFNDYRDKQEDMNNKRYNQMEKDYNEAVKTINNTRRIIYKTSRDLGTTKQ